MRKTLFLIMLSLVLGSMFTACSTDVDLYADYKNITVVYGLLDCNQDTNFIKINKAFLGPGNALDIALIADSCEYPGKLDAKIIEYRSSINQNNYQITNTYPLDTITIHTKEPGIFYAPDQKVYFTTERIKKNTDHFKYKYELQIDRGDTILTAETTIVGSDYFSVQDRSFTIVGSKGKIIWYECPNAAIYDVMVKFYFTEVGPGYRKEKCLLWPMGTFTGTESMLSYENGVFTLNYETSDFYNKLADFLGKDTLNADGTINTDVDRLVADRCVSISVSVGGEELYQFISANSPSSSIVQNIPEYTNINGGYGVFSSRVKVEQMVRLNRISELTNRENWRFRQGKEDY